MTFLEYVCEKLIGPPAFRSSDRSYWHCPFHDDDTPSFSTRPPKNGHKDRWSCFGCGSWGDALDLIKHFRSGLDYGQRLDMLDAMRAEFERAGLSSGGRGVRERQTFDASLAVGMTVAWYANEGWKEKQRRDAVKFAAHLLSFCDHLGCDPAELGQACDEWLEANR